VVLAAEYVDREGIDDESLIEVWCVFDADNRDRSASNCQRLSEAFCEAKAKNCHCAFSNPKFELWYLLHYENCRDYVTGQEVDKRLKKHLKNYSKSQRGLYELLESKQGSALKRAKAMRTLVHDSESIIIPSNPSTDVDKLIEFLLSQQHDSSQN